MTCGYDIIILLKQRKPTKHQGSSPDLRGEIIVYHVPSFFIPSGRASYISTISFFQIFYFICLFARIQAGQKVLVSGIANAEYLRHNLRSFRMVSGIQE